MRSTPLDTATLARLHAEARHEARRLHREAFHCAWRAALAWVQRRLSRKPLHALEV